jgi:hypothetical protein
MAGSLSDRGYQALDAGVVDDHAGFPLAVAVLEASLLLFRKLRVGFGAGVVDHGAESAAIQAATVAG